MKTRLSLLLLLLVGAVGAATAQMQDYKLKVGAFDKLKVTDNVNVVYRCVPDSAGFVTYRGDKEFADAFILSVNKGTLQVQVSTEDVDMPGLPVLNVYSDFLTEVKNSSDFTVTVLSPAPSPEFTAIQVGNGSIVVDDVQSTKVTASLRTGNGTINISGTCEEASLGMLGTGQIAADMLKAGNVSCKIMGSGVIGCYPTAKLDVKGIGSTKIYYKGSPVVKKSGGGKLFQLRLDPGSEHQDTIPED